MSINLPGDVATDIRQPILGDSFGWDTIEPAAAKKTIVIHATASQAANEDGFTMADYHVNHNGWGGIGVHFVVTKDNYPGKPGFTGGGAQVQYVGDLLTSRAGVWNNNPGKVHIEISGLFTPGNGVPSQAQLRACRKLIDFLLAKNNILPSMNFPSQVSYHNAVAVQPQGATACPGWQHPQFSEWFRYLQGGPEPTWWNPAPQPVPEPTPEPAQPSIEIPVTVVPAPPAASEWVDTYQPLLTTKKQVTRVATQAIDLPSGNKVSDIPEGHEFDAAGTMRKEGQLYVRSVYSATHNTWVGVPAVDLVDIPIPTTVSNTTPEDLIDSIVPAQVVPSVVNVPLWLRFIRWLGSKLNKGKN